MNGFSRMSVRALGSALVAGVMACMASQAALAQGGTNSRLPSMTKIKSLSVPYFALEFIAAERDLFKKYNLDVEFVTQVAQGSAGIPAIVAGHVQTGQGFGVPPILQARAGGARVTAVYAGITSTYGDFRFYTLADSGIKTAKGLAGKSFGINNFGTYADIALLAFLAKDKVDVSQVRRLTVPLPAMCQALLSKQVDAVAMYSLFYVPCEKENAGKVVVLAKDSDAIPAAAKLYSAYVFADDYIRENPGVVRAYIAGMRDAADYVNKNPDAARDIISKRTKIPADKIVVPTFAKNGCIDTQAAGDWVGVMVQHKAIAAGSASPTNWVNNSLNTACN
jgi:ABC-type nitrate/sulfonate/bicarbonate transport system substrate-binding protein